MSGPWEKYATPEAAGPWAKYAQANIPKAENASKPAASALAKMVYGGMSTINAAQQGVRDMVAGGVRGAGSIGATAMMPFDAMNDRVDPQRGITSLVTGQLSKTRNEQRRAEMDAALQAMGANPTSFAYGGGKLAGEIAGTAGVGGGIANLVGRAAPALAARAAPALDALRTAGMSAGGVTGAPGLALRTGAGAVTGGASALAVNPEDAGMGAGIGAVLPGTLQGLGKVGRAVGKRVLPGQPPVGMLAEALGVSEAEAQRMIAVARQQPDAIVPGSKLTFAQALQLAGENQPGVKLLERVVSGGPGGDTLLKRYADQAEARMAALKAHGAQTYQGAAAEEATRQGDKLGAILRTQATDDKQAARAAWESVYGRMADEGASMYLPLDELGNAMKPLGPGTVGAGKDAASLVGEARRVGIVEVENAVEKARKAAEGLTLAQAVRKAGGINLGRAGTRGGELKNIRESHKNLVYTSSGKDLEHMAMRMYEDGYLPDGEIDTLIEALKSQATGGRTASSQWTDEAFRRANMSADDVDAMLRAPKKEQVPVPVPFDTFQRLRRSAGDLGAKVGSREGGATEAGVMAEIQKIITAKADAAAAGNLRPGEFMSPGAAAQYNAARGMTRDIGERYKGGNNITSILRKPVGQDYALTGDEIFRKLWHGGAGLAGDVANLKGVLSPDNFEPGMNALRQGVMTDAASRTTAAGTFGAGLPRYVETRLPGLEEAMKPDQLAALKSVAADIRNAEAAGSVAGLRGSDTQAKITRALDAGLIDGPLLKTLSKVLSLKGVGLETLRAKVAESLVKSKGAAMADMLANRGSVNALLGPAAAPGNALNALQSPELQQFILRGAPVAQPWASR